MTTSTKLTLFRIVYLIISLGLSIYTGYLLVRNILVCMDDASDFNGIIILFALLAAMLFEISIVLFIIRSLRSRQTILMKNLVFKADGTPFRAGVGMVSLGGLVFIGLSLLIHSSVGRSLFSAAAPSVRLFVADVALIFGVNLLTVLLYFFFFRHESGIFELI